jgi:hypothetical protein
MCGVKYSTKHKYTNSYIKNNSTQILLKNGVKLLKINKTSQHFVDNYSSDCTVATLAENTEYNDPKQLIIETLFYNKIKCNNANKFIFCVPSGDSMTNIEITTKSNVNLISAQIKNMTLQFDKTEHNNLITYKITNFDNINHYCCILHEPILEFTFDTCAKFNFKYDRGTGNAKVRKALVNAFTGIPLNSQLQPNHLFNNPINLSNMSIE